MDAPVWVPKLVVLAIHDEQLAEHGGAQGLRDERVLEAALDRPRNRLLYDNPDMAFLAASYGFGLANNHPFVDGNKRTSFVVTELFLHLNGFQLAMDDAKAVSTWLALAAGHVSEGDLAAEIRAVLRPRGGASSPMQARDPS